MIKPKPKPQQPRVVVPGDQFRGKNGHVYTVVFLTNLHVPARIKDEPITVVYIGPLGRLWSHPLAEFFKKFDKKLNLAI